MNVLTLHKPGLGSASRTGVPIMVHIIGASLGFNFASCALMSLALGLGKAVLPAAAHTHSKHAACRFPHPDDRADLPQNPITLCIAPLAQTAHVGGNTVDDGSFRGTGSCAALTACNLDQCELLLHQVRLGERQKSFSVCIHIKRMKKNCSCLQASLRLHQKPLTQGHTRLYRIYRNAQP